MRDDSAQSEPLDDAGPCPFCERWISDDDWKYFHGRGGCINDDVNVDHEGG